MVLRDIFYVGKILHIFMLCWNNMIFHCDVVAPFPDPIPESCFGPIVRPGREYRILSPPHQPVHLHRLYVYPLTLHTPIAIPLSQPLPTVLHQYHLCIHSSDSTKDHPTILYLSIPVSPPSSPSPGPEKRGVIPNGFKGSTTSLLPEENWVYGSRFLYRII